MYQINKENYRLQEEKISKYILKSINVNEIEAGDMAMSIFDWLADNNIMEIPEDLLPAMVIAGLSTEEEWKVECFKLYFNFRKDKLLSDLIDQIRNIGYEKDLTDSYIDSIKTLEREYLSRQRKSEVIVFSGLIPVDGQRVHCKVMDIKNSKLYNGKDYRVLFSYTELDKINKYVINTQEYYTLYEKSFCADDNIDLDEGSAAFIEYMVEKFNSLEKQEFIKSPIMLLSNIYDHILYKYIVKDSIELARESGNIYGINFGKK